MKTQISRFVIVCLSATCFLLINQGCQRDNPAELPEISTLPPTSVTTNSASSGGSVTFTGSAPVTSRGVVWGTTANPTVENHFGITQDGEGSGSFVSILTGLSPGTVYFVRGYAVSIFGTAYGNEVEFETVTQVGNVSDVNGNRYGVVTIGNQVWMAENLRTKKYADGSAIAGGLHNNSWKSTTGGAWAVYPHSISGLESEEEVLATYGALYNWYAVQDERKLCPAGWKIPSDEDWTELTDYLTNQFGLKNEPEASNGLANSLKSCHQVSSPLGDNCSTNEHPRWNSHNVHYGTDNFGFAAVPGSNRDANGSFGLIGSEGLWWTSTGDGGQKAIYRSIKVNAGSMQRSADSRNMGLSVRCIRE